MDPSHKAIRRDPRINWITQPTMKHRELRGQTAAGRRSRGVGKGGKFSKTQPSMRASWKRRQKLSLRRYR